MPHKKGHWGYNTRKKIQKFVGNKSKLLIDKGQKSVNKFNPQSESNKSIRKKESIIKSNKSTRQEKSVAKVQKAAHIRKRDGVKVADLQAKRRQEMRDRAAAKNKAFKEKQKSFRNRKRK